IIDRLLDEGIIHDMADLFLLQEKDIAGLERFAEKSAENLIAAIREKRGIPLARFVYGLGIRNVGEQTAIDLAGKFGSLENLKKASLEDFESITNIGPVVAKSAHEWFNDKENRKLLDKLEKSGVKIINPKVFASGKKLAGKKFVITGSLETMQRDEAKNKIRELGGQVSESVSKNIDYLVAGSEAGSKLDKAKKLGVKILTGKEFLELLGNTGY
ncbi:MAG: helix-hairpin-helix domain-containing protein, partial [bacterium]|nr:helix-hairpin-helix domain-containing protein [bacterium]